MAAQHPLDLFIFAGEMSGDTLGAALLDELTHLNCAGVGGPKMRARPFECLFKMEQFEVMGFIDVIAHLPRLLRLMGQIKQTILTRQPKCVVLIDYPGFNLKLAEKLRKGGYKGKIVQYVCPSVWAWKKGRIPKMARDFDQLLALLPFEPACFANTKLPALFVGHPLVKEIPSPKPRPSKNRLSLFPGSRKKETARNFAIQLSVARRLQAENPDMQLAILVADNALLPLLESHNLEGIELVERDQSRELMAQTDLAIATSGTVVLELALSGVPTAVNYALSKFDQFLATKVFKISLPYYSLPNLIAGQEIFPELYGSNLSKESLYNAVKGLMQRDHIAETLEQKVRAPLIPPDSEKSAAKAINNLIF